MHNNIVHINNHDMVSYTGADSLVIVAAVRLCERMPEKAKHGKYILLFVIKTVCMFIRQLLDKWVYKIR